MAIHTLGTNANTSLNAIQWFPPGATSSSVNDTLSFADYAAITQSVTSPGRFGSSLSGSTATATGILTTATTHSNTTLDTLVSTAGAGLSTIQIGYLVLGVGIPPGTFVSAIASSTSLTLSQAATASASGVAVAFVPPNAGAVGPNISSNLLILPQRRGVIYLQNGDYVALDNTGYPIVIPKTSVSYSGSLWHFV